MRNKMQLFCFTHAGGTADFFNLLESELNNVELIKFEYSGHGSRSKEKFYEDFQDLADDLYNQLLDKLNQEYALFGYSMGCISAVEVLRRIYESDLPKPKHIFLAAHSPCTLGGLCTLKEDELDSWVKERTLQFGDIPEILVYNKVFWRTYLPLYKADYEIIGKYRFEELNLKSEIPTTIFYSENDTPICLMKDWDKYFIGDIEFFEYDGNHFFIREHNREIATVIKKQLKVRQ